MSAPAQQPQLAFEVDLPAGGKIVLRTKEEVDVWEELSDKYQKEYGLSKANDLAILGAVLTQHLSIFRAQQKLSGMTPELDSANVPTGRYKIDPNVKDSDLAAATAAITKASTEIREMEKALGIDKKTREAGGAFNVQDYLQTLKRAAHRFGVHVQKRVFMYEEFGKELNWRLRLLDNGDDEDKQHHGVSEKAILDFCRTKLGEIEAAEKTFSNKQQIFIGKL